MKNKTYDVITPTGSRVVLIDEKISIKAYFKLFCERLSDWFNSAEVDDILCMLALTFSFLGIYCAAAFI